MKDSFFRSMTWLHTWVGLLVCWVLLIIFFAGSLSYFRHEISLWTAPELHKNVFYTDTALAQQNQLPQMLSHAQAYLTEHASHAKDWQISLPTPRRPYISYAWQEQASEPGRRGVFVEKTIDRDFAVIDDKRDSRGGNFFYRLHFDLQYIPVLYARWLVGFCTMFMFIALLSGIVIHKRIFKDFFSFRPSKGSRSWLDAHNISSVLALPYHLMITYSGLITLMVMFMPWGVLTNYDGDAQAFRAEVQGPGLSQQPNNEPISTVDLNADLNVDLNMLVQAIYQDVGPSPIKQISIHGPLDSKGTVSIYLDPQQNVTDKRLAWVFSNSDGTLISQPDSDKGSQSQASFVTHDMFMALHTARFSENILRGFFFVCGLLGCAMIATGTLLWALKIRQKQTKQLDKGLAPSLGLRAVETLNIMFIAGMPLGTAVFFYANRLLPASMTGRADWEAHCFFIALALVGAIALYQSLRAKRGVINLGLWQAVLALSALSFALLPVINSATAPQGLMDNIALQQWVLVGFDFAFILTALLLSVACFKIRQKQKRPRVQQAQGLQKKGHKIDVKQADAALAISEHNLPSQKGASS
jgi:uncharacterized iron-regulated membrane protein